jgi:hypothetical protein
MRSRFVSVAIDNVKSKIEIAPAGVVQWQNGSFPSCTRGFDSLHPLRSSRHKAIEVNRPYLFVAGVGYRLWGKRPTLNA